MLNISPLKDKDIPAVVAIENLSFAAPKSEDVFREDEHKYLVARDKDKIVGYIGIEDIASEKHIINMAVHPDYRNKGIGKRLIETVLNDKEVLFLEVRASNLSAQSLYKKYGFSIVGIRKHYYSDNDEDAYIMKKRGK